MAFDYLVDPRNRPTWQSSLRRVEQVAGDTGVGQTWVDVTAAGVRPAMETTAFDRPRLWTERGSWRRVDAELTLTFEPSPGGCLVAADASVSGPGPVGAALTRLAPYAIRADLRRAARILSARRAAD